MNEQKIEYLGSCNRAIPTSTAVENYSPPPTISGSNQHVPYIRILTPSC